MKKNGCWNCDHWERRPVDRGQCDRDVGKCYGQPPNTVADKPFSMTYSNERCPLWKPGKE